MNAKESKVLRHIMLLISERVSFVKPLSQSSTDFERGEALAYHEVIGFIEESFELFNLPLQEVGLDNLNSELLL